MSIIEQAAKRLEELQRAGIDLAAGAGARREAPAEPSELPQPKRTEPRLERAPLLAEASRARFAPPTLEAKPAVQSRQVDIDLARVAAAGIVTPDAPRSKIADEFRVIKRPLLANASRNGSATGIHRGNLIVITSALPGEGKTFTAVNLAMSVAMEMDKTVLLVDADVGNPSVPRILGLPPSRGLLDVLVDGDADLSDVLVRTNVEKLSLLPAGTRHPRATEILASEGMSRLLDEMAQRYTDRIIIFDSPPLLATTEARVLASQMGQVVMVVQAQQTTQADVTQALATIESCPVKLMVLNKGRALKQARSNGHGYGYGYGDGS